MSNTAKHLAIQAITGLCGVADAEYFFSALNATGFSAEAYRAAHRDLIENCPDADAALAHFLLHGVRERRRFPIDLQTTAVEALYNCEVENGQYLVELLAALTNAYADGMRHRLDQVVPRIVDVLERLRPLGCRPFLLIGDSHSNLYRRSPTRMGEWLAPTHVLCSAGSAQGLANPASRSGYGNSMRRLIEGAECNSGIFRKIPIIFQFGQVDTEFVFTFQRIRQGRQAFKMADYEEFCLESVGSYMSWLCDTFSTERRATVTILSIFPPSLSDEKWAEGYVNAHILSLEASQDSEMMMEEIRTIEIPDFRTRTLMHAYYNTQLEAACIRDGFSFVDGFSPFLNLDGVLQPSFVPKTKGSDHHLEHEATKNETQSILWQIVDRLSSVQI